jgi:hypothetical protein
MTFAKPEKLVSLRVNRSGRPMIHQVSGRQRFFWRLVGVFAIPALLLVILAVKIIRVHEFRQPVRLLDLAIAAGFVAGIVLVTGMKMTLRPAGAFRYDISRERASAVDPRAAQWLATLQKPATVRYFTSPPNDMPINARDMENHVYTQLQALADASAGKLTIAREIVPGGAAEENKTLRATLDRFSIKPFKMRLIEEDRYVEKNVYSGLAFEYGGAVETIPQLTRQNAQRIEFLVVAAFKRLSDGKKPRIALVADMPHLSAGEFWELQQLESKIMPRSEDVYAGLIHILKNEGYQVTVYDSKAENRFTEDLLIFLQPWVVSDHMHKEFNRYLRAGGKVMLASQHFNMQVRKYSGLAYEVSYWPGPQFIRINELLEPYGIELVREVFFDQSKASIQTREQVRWGAYKKVGRTAPDAQPFIIRTVPSNYSAQSPITSRLSDILFIWGNRWRMDTEKFPEGLAWHPLIRSTPDSWGYDWQGGFIPPDILKGGDYLDEGQPLAVLVEGVFPAVKGAFSAPEKAGRLLLLGSSKIFANDQIEYDRYDHEKFILNAVADLVYGTEFARMQAWGTTAAAGFGFVPPGQKLLWRGFGIFFMPALFALFGFWYRRRA